MEITEAIARPTPMRVENHSRWARRDFEALFREHYPRIVAVIRQVVGDSGLAEEKAGEVFLKLHERPHLQSEPRGMRAWLYRVAVRSGLDAIRADSRRTRYEREAAPATGEQSPPLDDLLARERAQRVRAALAKLEPQRAQMLLLRHSGFSYQETAEALGLNPASVGTLLARAEAELARRYRELYPEEDKQSC
ncbi:MAG: sigma-70 family RNA polymerase sigma factor [Bryobacterales bacterium]